MHYSLPGKFAPRVPPPISPMSRLIHLITPIAGLFTTILFFLALKIYLPSSDFAITRTDSPPKPITSPSISQTSLEPPNADNATDPIPTPSIFAPPEPLIRPDLIIDKGRVQTGVDNSTVWYSAGRHPTNNECWSYTSRFQPYESPSKAVLNLISANNKPTNTRAIVVRLSSGHPWKRQFTLFARSLVLEAGYLANYSVVFLVHSDASPRERQKWIKSHVPAEFRNLTQSFSTADLKSFLNNTAPFKNVMEHNHLPLQMFMTKNPNFDFLYSVESDVRLIGRWDHFLSDIDSEYAAHRSHQASDQNLPLIPDLVGFESFRRPRKDWLWLDDSCVSAFGGHTNLRASIGPVWGWSRRLVEKLNGYNQNGINCYYEYFAPSVAYKEDLTTFFYQHPLYCADRSSPSGRNSMKLEELGRQDPRTVEHERVATGCTYFFVNPHSQKFWEEWYKARESADACWPTALVHPIKGEFFN